MKKILTIVICIIWTITGCSTKTKDDAAEKDSYEKATASLAERERKNPVNFLTVNSTDKHNLLGQTVIKGSISNKAKVCTYQDIKVELSFFSKTNVLLEKDSETIYEVIEPGKTADFKTKYFSPKGTDSVAVKIVSAKVK